MVKIGDYVYDATVYLTSDRKTMNFTVQAESSEIKRAFSNAAEIEVTQNGKTVTYFAPQLRQMIIEGDNCTVLFAAAEIPASVQEELEIGIDDANAGLVDVADYAASLDERITALEQMNAPAEEPAAEEPAEGGAE